ncbi:hypothetical protein FKM82_013301 [Ascaphus truei]
MELQRIALNVPKADEGLSWSGISVGNSKYISLTQAFRPLLEDRWPHQVLGITNALLQCALAAHAPSLHMNRMLDGCLGKLVWLRARRRGLQTTKENVT